jgi:hypothetical protein
MRKRSGRSRLTELKKQEIYLAPKLETTTAPVIHARSGVVHLDTIKLECHRKSTAEDNFKACHSCGGVGALSILGVAPVGHLYRQQRHAAPAHGCVALVPRVKARASSALADCKSLTPPRPRWRLYGVTSWGKPGGIESPYGAVACGSSCPDCPGPHACYACLQLRVKVSPAGCTEWCNVGRFGAHRRSLISFYFISHGKSIERQSSGAIVFAFRPIRR